MDRRTEKIAHLFAGYIQWIFDSCQKIRIQKIFFLTREGEFFKRIADVIVNEKTEWKTSFQIDILEVSRISTFAPSIYQWNVTEFKRMWSLYTQQSMKALCVSVCEDISVMEPYIEKYGLTAEESVTDPWKDDRVLKLFQDIELKRIMETEFEKKRDVLKQYLQQKGIGANEKESIALVDIGWRGTIQDNIARIFPGEHFEGFYLCIAPFLNEQPSNVHKQSYLSGTSGRIILKYPTPVEVLCNSPEGSVSGYRQTENGIEAVREIELSENRAYDMYVGNFQRELIDYLKRKYSKDKAPNLQIGRRGLEGFLLWPDRNAAEAFFSLSYNEKFGNGKYIDKNNAIDHQLFLRAIFDKEKRKQLKQELWETTWPQGYLVRNKRVFWLIIYNLLLESKNILMKVDGHTDETNKNANAILETK